LHKIIRTIGLFTFTLFESVIEALIPFSL